MKTRLGFFVLAIAGTCSAGLDIQASTVTDDFQFLNGSAVVATGAFSYDNSKSGLLSFSDLSSFSIIGAGNSYSLADVTGVSLLSSYNYFGYDTGSNSFLPTLVDGPLGKLDVIFSALYQTVQDNGNGTKTVTTLSGFLFDPLPSQDDPNGGNDGLYAFYNPPNCGDGQCLDQFPSFTSFSVSAVPEPSTWVMMLLGFVGLSLMICRRKSNGGLKQPLEWLGVARQRPRVELLDV